MPPALDVKLAHHRLTPTFWNGASHPGSGFFTAVTGRQTGQYPE